MNKKNIKEFLLYVIVGGIATVGEWVVFFALDKFMIHYAAATVIAYIFSTFLNWGAGRILVFKSSGQTLAREIISIYLTSIGGMLLNLLIMWIAVDLFAIDGMISKIIATAIVFFYNFLVRKILIYKK